MRISVSASTARTLLVAGAAGALGLGLVRRWRAMELEGAIVLVTGGSRGLGFALARALGARGARVAICARDRTELESAVERLDALGIDGLAIECDVSDRRDVSRMVRRITDELGPIDVLVNNAGVIRVGPLTSMGPREFEESLAVNFWGTVNPTLAVLPGMRERGRGRIANITSIGGRLGVPHLIPYSAAKFAAYGFSEGLRAEEARHGIRVTTVVPGLMRTGGPAHARFDGDPEKEFAWFSLADATPLTATNADRAARRIVRAVRLGEAFLTLTWQARLVRLAHDLFPTATLALSGLAARLLPSGEGRGGSALGMELVTPLSPSRLTRGMNRAGIELQQYAGSHRPSPEHARRIGLPSERSDGR